ncbi:MAG TPA: PilZ domain-containing protein [Candidatus Acidoferrum sp.]|nr:PilZ domain-containing protein [Candidatus Acidoferrum sp.]
MRAKRRSGRIAKELPILLLGTDTTGRVFSEETKTVVLSRHGAGIISRYAFAPDEVLTMRLLDTQKEAEIRLVGKIGGEAGNFVYGVAFVDPEIRFWPIDFSPAEATEAAALPVFFQCNFCHSRQAIEPAEIEEDVYNVSGSVLRECRTCGRSTPWTRAADQAAEDLSRDDLRRADSSVPAEPLVSPRAPSPTNTLEPVSSLGPSERASWFEGTPPDASSGYSGQASLGSGTDPAFSAYSTTALETLPTAAVQTSTRESSRQTENRGEVVRAEDSAGANSPRRHDALSGSQKSPQPVDANGRRINRRKHTRVRVSFSACIRDSTQSDDIVECENVSKGGLCFHSRRQYAVGARIEIAAPFSPGEPALFVTAQIMRVEELIGAKTFRYGVAYVK